MNVFRRGSVAILLMLMVIDGFAEGVPTIEITDCMGRNVTIPDNVSRVVSLYPDATRILVSLGAGTEIVGVDSYSLKCPILKKVYPKLQETVDVGSSISGTLSMEALASLKPDVIFVGGSSQDLAEKIQNEFKIPCVCTYFNVKKVDDFLCAYDLAGRVMNKEGKSQEIQRFIADEIGDMINVTSTIPDDEKPTLVMIGMPLGNDPFKVATVSAAVDWAGGINLGADEYKGGSPSKTVTIEQIASWDPDLILINGLSLVNVSTIEDDSNWNQLRAVKDGRVYKFYSGMVGYDPAIFVIQPLNLAKIMHPDRYDFDFATKADLVFEKIYDVRGLHTVFETEFGISEV